MPGDNPAISINISLHGASAKLWSNYNANVAGGKTNPVSKRSLFLQNAIFTMSRIDVIHNGGICLPPVNYVGRNVTLISAFRLWHR